MSHSDLFADRLRDGERSLLELFRTHAPGIYNKNLRRRDRNRQQQALFSSLTYTTNAPDRVIAERLESEVSL